MCDRRAEIATPSPGLTRGDGAAGARVRHACTSARTGCSRGTRRARSSCGVRPRARDQRESEPAAASNRGRGQLDRAGAERAGRGRVPFLASLWGPLTLRGTRERSEWVVAARIARLREGRKCGRSPFPDRTGDPLGRRLLVVTLPRRDQDAKIAYAALVAFARAHGIRLVDPQAGSDIDLDRPSVLPPMR
jgi:hypothetical protein